MNSFPFPKLLTFLETEADQLEFMKVCAEVGLGSTDQELAKLLLALQLYKAFYAKVPREMKSVHGAALLEMRALRDEMKSFSERTAADASRVGQWSERIQQSLATIQPKNITEHLHQRLLEETTTALSGSVQKLGTAYRHIDTATAALNAATGEAQASIQVWQALTLRRVWFSAFLCSLILAPLLLGTLQFFYSKFETWRGHIQYEIHNIIH